MSKVKLTTKEIKDAKIILHKFKTQQFTPKESKNGYEFLNKIYTKITGIKYKEGGCSKCAMNTRAKLVEKYINQVEKSKRKNTRSKD